MTRDSSNVNSSTNKVAVSSAPDSVMFCVNRIYTAKPNVAKVTPTNRYHITPRIKYNTPCLVSPNRRTRRNLDYKVNHLLMIQVLHATLVQIFAGTIDF